MDYYLSCGPLRGQSYHHHHLRRAVWLPWDDCSCSRVLGLLQLQGVALFGVICPAGSLLLELSFGPSAGRFFPSVLSFLESKVTAKQKDSRGRNWRGKNRARKEQDGVRSVISAVFQEWVHARCWWLTSVILAIQESEIRRIAVWTQPQQRVCKTLFKKNSTQKKGLVE
jgi:hypothetical protein